MRTELRFGDVSHELARQLAELPGQMLILGIKGSKDLAERFSSLFADAHWLKLIVHREHEGPSAPNGNAEKTTECTARVGLTFGFTTFFPHCHRAGAPGGIGADDLASITWHDFVKVVFSARAIGSYKQTLVRRILPGCLHQPSLRIHDRLDADQVRVPRQEGD